jgi:hypothetical protein
MLLYSSMASRGQQEARALLEERWHQIDKRTWKARLQAGDVTAWREMLIDHYMSAGPLDDIVGPLKAERSFAASDLSHLPSSRLGMLCEAYFYDALLAKAKHDESRMRSRLQDVLLTERLDYLEYSMAKFLLTQDSLAGSRRATE